MTASLVYNLPAIVAGEVVSRRWGASQRERERERMRGSQGVSQGQGALLDMSDMALENGARII